MFVVGKDRVDQSNPVFGVRADMISFSYLAFGAILDRIANGINYPNSPFYPTRIG